MTCNCHWGDIEPGGALVLMSLLAWVTAGQFG